MFARTHRRGKRDAAKKTKIVWENTKSGWLIFLRMEKVVMSPKNNPHHQPA
jgi:hypothetical protein